MEQDAQHDAHIEWISLTDAANLYGVAKSTISRIVKRNEIPTSNDPVVTSIKRIDKQRLMLVMSSSVRYKKR